MRIKVFHTIVRSLQPNLDLTQDPTFTALRYQTGDPCCAISSTDEIACATNPNAPICMDYLTFCPQYASQWPATLVVSEASMRGVPTISTVISACLLLISFFA